MAEPHVSLAPGQSASVPENLRGPLEDQLSSALQRATGIVADDYDGEPVDDVADELLAETKSALHPDIAEAFEPSPAQMRHVAEEIVRRQ